MKKESVSRLLEREKKKREETLAVPTGIPLLSSSSSFNNHWFPSTCMDDELDANDVSLSMFFFYQTTEEVAFRAHVNQQNEENWS